VRLVEHLDGKTQTPHPDLVNSELAMVALVLFVVQFGPDSARPDYPWA
jgi:hypothetical protein